MSDLKGTSRMPTQFVQQEDADPRLTNMLTLYKQPATIRDMKQTYFYCGVASNLTFVDPIIHQYGFDIEDYLTPGTDATSVNSVKNGYYSKLGTTRTLNIENLINDLIDIRVPKDKYVVEINLAECVLEVDSKGWQNNPDFVIRYGPKISSTNTAPKDYLNLLNAVNKDPTYTWELVRSNDPSPDFTPPRYTYDSALVQANKITEPQTLYLRIRELDNGEPYNWAVTNSGSYSIDKGHQLLVRHGDVNFANLTLEFGHLGFVGNDADYFNYLQNRLENHPLTREYLQENAQLVGLARKNPMNRYNYNNFKYIDYNSEVFNVVGANSNPEADGMYSSYAYGPVYEYPNAIYPKFYGGLNNDYCFALSGPPGSLINRPNEKLLTLSNRVDDNLERPSNRPPFKFMGVRDGTNPSIPQNEGNDQVYVRSTTASTAQEYTKNPYLLRGSPLFYNQQVSKIGFRFLVRVIHLF